MNKQRGLGRGLEALIPQLGVHDTDVVTSVDIRELRPNPYQPRQHFDQERLDELASSIREHGIIQPLIVRKSSVKGYDIVAGERRFRAAQVVGLTTVPAVVRDFTDTQIMEIALIENLQREDLNAIEIAEAYSNLIDKCHLTQDELAKRVGQSRSHVANMLRLLHLPDTVRDLVSRGTLSMGHARALLAVDDNKQLHQLAEKVVQDDWSVRKLESAVYQGKTEKQGKSEKELNSVSRETPNTNQQVYFRRYEEQFRSYLGTSVKIHPGKKRGKIEIEYFSHDDLDRILTLISGSGSQGGG